MSTKQIIVVLICLFFLGNFTLLAQSKKIPLDSLQLKNTVLILEKYEPIGKLCENKKGNSTFCSSAARLFDNNFKDLTSSHELAASYLNIQYEIISKTAINKEIYKDKNTYRYVFQYEPIISKKVGSCMSNPGGLLIKFSVWDRLEDKVYDLDIKYSFFTCDIDLLINAINKSIAEPKLPKN